MWGSPFSKRAPPHPLPKDFDHFLSWREQCAKREDWSGRRANGVRPYMMCHPDRANKRERRDLQKRKKRFWRCVCTKLSLRKMLLIVHGIATLFLRSRYGFALRFARLLRYASQISTTGLRPSLRMTRTEIRHNTSPANNAAIRNFV